MSAEVCYLDVAGYTIAYRIRAGVQPTLVYLSGYASDMEGTKACALDDLAHRRGCAMLRFDYSGTGLSSGKFEEGTLASWVGEALALVDRLTSGPLILIGSSMGGWIALHLALLRPERVQALVGISIAPDFTNWGLGQAEKSELRRRGHILQASPDAAEPALFTQAFVDSGQRLLLLEGEIPIDCPVHLIHGENDQEVPFEIGLRTMRALRSADVQLNLVKGGGHRLSRPHEIETILLTVANLLEPAP